MYTLCASLSAQTVYITNTGAKYHTGSCRYLSHSKIETTLAKAIEQGYEACKVCKPTQRLNNTKQETIKQETIKQDIKEPETKTSDGRCTATTQKGTRCKRAASSNGKCWQHGG